MPRWPIGENHVPPPPVTGTQTESMPFDGCSHQSLKAGVAGAVSSIVKFPPTSANISAQVGQRERARGSQGARIDRRLALPDAETVSSVPAMFFQIDIERAYLARNHVVDSMRAAPAVAPPAA